MDEVISRLGISKGSASQGLRRLDELGMLRTVYLEANRRRHYVAELELRRLISGFIKNHFVLRIESGRNRLRELTGLIPKLPDSYAPVASTRLERLARWHDRASAALPLAMEFLPED